MIIDCSVSMNTSSFFFTVVVAFPLNLALNLTLEESRDACGHQGHFDIKVTVGFQFTLHGLKAQVISTHEARLSEIKLQLLGRIQIIQDNKTVRMFTSF